MIETASAVEDDFESWLSWQQYRSDSVGELARLLNRGHVLIGNLPAAMRPVLTAARIDFMAGGPILAGTDVSARVATIREAAGLKRVPA
jgi:hypothetical protein